MLKSGRGAIAVIVAVMGMGLATVGTVYLTRAMAQVTALAAVVNGEAIYQRDVEAEVELVAFQYGLTFEGQEGQSQRQELKRAVLDQLMDRKILMQEARRLGQVATDYEVDLRLAAIREQFGSEEAFQEALAARNLSLLNLRERIRVDQTVNRIIEKLATGEEVREAEMQEYFTKHRGELGEPEQVHVRHILVRTEAEAKVVEGKLQRGEDFATLARQHSIDLDTREKGGDLGFITRGQYEEAFTKVAFGLPAGQIGGPVKTSQGYHLIQVLERKPARPAVYEEVKERIERTLRQQKAEERFDRWFRETRAKAKIVRFDRPKE
ncbi:MAG: peptidylprolyl isomerase [Armatimonadota bacterium]|nr:peptidylprolyl isomerase [Armatimonadota bacterium]MDR5703511.1 peptidylprolyl isomerase [Armatimonadota bacterium]